LMFRLTTASPLKTETRRRAGNSGRTLVCLSHDVTPFEGD
jgi:hypothetical protein